MIQIALIAGTYQPDRCGVAQYTACLRSHLQAQNVRSIVLTTQKAANAIDAATADPTIKGVVADWGIKDLAALVRAVQVANPDVLHIQHAAGTYGFQRAVFLLPLLLRLRGWQKPIVTTVHEYGWWEWQPPHMPPRLLEWLKQWGQTRVWWDREDGFLLTRSNAIITTNAEAESAIRARLPDLMHRVARIPIAANIKVAPIARLAARQQLRQRCGWSEDTLAIAFFGFLHPVKGLETLLPAFQQVQAQRPQARLLLVGGVESLALRGQDAATYWDKIHAIAADLGLSQQVQITGYLSAEMASQYLTGADIGVLPFNHGVTLKSGSLLTLMAHGLPIVATHSNPPDPDLPESGLPESGPYMPDSVDGQNLRNRQSLMNEQTLRFVPPRDRHALANALLELIDQPKLRSHLSQAGQVFVQQFSWEAIAQRHVQIYLSQLARTRGIVEESNLVSLQ